MLEYGLIGNCQVSALVSNLGSVDWMCVPRPDSPPVFGKLLDPDGGSFSIALEGEKLSSFARYLPNTNVLETTISNSAGDAIRIIDFCPRFLQYGRIYRPHALFRIVEPLSGVPRVRVGIDPVEGWSKTKASAVRGSSHARFSIEGSDLRLLTDFPLTFLLEGTSVPLTARTRFALTWGVGIEEDLAETTEAFLEKTLAYWRTWVKHCTIPTRFQDEVIRSALALKLHCHEDTGAILAALTTSLPEEIGAQRNWDYRYCWIRDAAFTLGAFRRIGHFEEMEGFLRFLLGIVLALPDSEGLKPVYALDGSLPLPEETHAHWEGLGGSKPVRSRNQAAEHTQNDVYGETILALAPLYLDRRFLDLRTPELDRTIARLARECSRRISQPDAGLWETRDGWKEHSFSNLMCWAGLERAKRIFQTIGTPPPFDFDEAIARAKTAIEAGVRDGTLRNGPGDATRDASLLLLPILRYPDKELSARTVRETVVDLRFPEASSPPGFLYRYRRKDDFGAPRSAFLLCSFWAAESLSRIGEKKDAEEWLTGALRCMSPLGLFSEHYDPANGVALGNFPQAYSHVGLIHAAFALSPQWEDWA